MNNLNENNACTTDACAHQSPWWYLGDTCDRCGGWAPPQKDDPQFVPIWVDDLDNNPHGFWDAENFRTFFVRDGGEIHLQGKKDRDWEIPVWMDNWDWYPLENHPKPADSGTF